MDKIPKINRQKWCMLFTLLFLLISCSSDAPVCPSIFQTDTRISSVEVYQPGRILDGIALMDGAHWDAPGSAVFTHENGTITIDLGKPKIGYRWMDPSRSQ